jgi:hypothetical protein
MSRRETETFLQAVKQTAPALSGFRVRFGVSEGATRSSVSTLTRHGNADFLQDGWRWQSVAGGLKHLLDIDIAADGPRLGLPIPFFRRSSGIGAPRKRTEFPPSTTGTHRFTT